jgi:hypothetical protein
MCVDPTEEGIGTGNTLDDIGCEPHGEEEEDSVFDENLEIMDLEMRDFDDVDGIDSDGE